MAQRELNESGLESENTQQADGLKLVEDAYQRGDWSVLKVQSQQDGTGHESGQHLPKLEPGTEAPQIDRGDALPKQNDGEAQAEAEESEPETGIDALKAIENPSAAVKQFIEAYDKFDKVPDKTKALEEIGPQFDEAIKTADTTFSNAMKDALTNGRELTGKMAEAQEEIGLHLDNVGAEMEKLPNEADREKVKEVMGALLREEDPAKEQELLKQLQPFERVHAAVKAFNEALNKHEPTVKKMEEMATNMASSVAETAALRMVYSELLRENGDTEKADAVEAQALAIMKMMMGGQGQEDPDNDGVPRFRTLPWTVPQDDGEVEIRRV